jgi:hypothetical protein
MAGTGCSQSPQCWRQHSSRSPAQPLGEHCSLTQHQQQSWGSRQLLRTSWFSKTQLAASHTTDGRCVLHTLAFPPQGVPLPAVAAWQLGPHSRSCLGSTVLPGLAAVGRSCSGCCSPPGVCRDMDDLLQLPEPWGAFCGVRVSVGVCAAAALSSKSTPVAARPWLSAAYAHKS